jgi:hypothetical protein
MLPSFAACEPADASHVLREHLPRVHTPDEEQPQVAVAGEQDVVGLGRQPRADADGLLAATHVDAADNLPLPVELPFNAVLHLAHQEHVMEEFSGQLGLVVGRFHQLPAGPR